MFWNHSNEASVSADGLVAILLVLLGSRSLLESLALRSAIQGSGFQRSALLLRLLRESENLCAPFVVVVVPSIFVCGRSL